MTEVIFLESACSEEVKAHLLPDERVEISLVPQRGAAAASQQMVLTSRRILGFRNVGFMDVITTFPYSCFVAVELHDSVRTGESQVHLRLSGLMDPARVLPYLQVSDRGTFERVWGFFDRTTARRAYNALVAHLT